MAENLDAGAGGHRWWQALAVRWPYLLVVVGIVASIGPPLWGHGVLHASDLLGTLQPWRASRPAGFAPDNGQVSDTVNAVIPLRAEFSRRLWDGDFAFWAGDQGSGIPLGSVPDLSLLSPLTLPYYLFPLWWAPAVSKALEMGVAAAFTILLLRRLGTGRVPATVGGVIYMGSGFQVSWTNWPQTFVGAFVPMLFWAVERAVQLRSARSLVPVALAVAFLLFGGFPAVTGHAVVAAGVYAAVRCLWLSGAVRPRVGWLAALGAAVVLGVGLAALQVLPFVDRLRSLDLDYRSNIAGQHLPLDALVTSVIPWSSGAYVDGVYLSERNVVESLSFVGVVAAVLMVVAAVGGYRLSVPAGVRPVLWTTLVLGTAMTFWGGPVLTAAETVLPPLFAENFVGRLRALLCFVSAVLAGVGAQVVADGASGLSRPGLRELGRRTAPRLVVTAAVLAFLVLTAGKASYDQAVDALEFGYLKDQARLPVAVGAAVVVVIVLAWLTPRRFRPVRFAALALLPVLVLVQSVPVARTFFPRIDREDFYPVTATHEFLFANLGEDRILQQQRVLEPGSTSYYGLRTVAAHQFFEPEWRALMSEADPFTFERGRNTFPFFGTDTPTSERAATSPIMDRLSARYYVTNPGRLALGRQPAEPPLRGGVDLVPGTALEADAPTGEIRAVRIWLRDVARAVTGRVAEIRLTVVGPDGTVLGTGRHRADDPPTSVNKGPMDIAIPQVTVPAGSRLRLELVDARRPLPLSLSAGSLAVEAVRAQDDGLRTAYADTGSVVYERTRVLPRVRWASATTVITDPAARVSALQEGIDADTVLLSAPGPAAGGGDAVIEVAPGEAAFDEDLVPGRDGPPASRTGDGDRVSADVTASTEGYLVIADGLQQGWSATVDGRAAELVDADHALVAVHVPAGSHRVELQYDSPGSRTGQVVSFLAVLIVLVLSVLSPVRRRFGELRNRRRAADRSDGDPPLVSPAT